MPPKANKIATAIAAVNRTVVKNYNAANRAINRAPAWVKWTIAAIAVAIIGYAIWKVFFARKKEGFDDVQGFVKYEGKDMTFCSDLKSIVNTTVADAATACGEGCDGFTFDNRGPEDIAYLKSFSKNDGKCDNGGPLQCNDMPGLVMYIKTGKDSDFKRFCTGVVAGVATGGDGGCFVGNGWNYARFPDEESGFFMKFNDAYYFFHSEENTLKNTYDPSFLQNTFVSPLKVKFREIGDIGKYTIHDMNEKKILKIFKPNELAEEYAAGMFYIEDYKTPRENTNAFFEFALLSDGKGNYQLKWDALRASSSGAPLRYALSRPTAGNVASFSVKLCSKKNDIENTFTIEKKPLGNDSTFILQTQDGQIVYYNSASEFKLGFSTKDKHPTNAANYFKYKVGTNSFQIMGNSNADYLVRKENSSSSSWLEMDSDTTTYNLNQFQLYSTGIPGKYHIRLNQTIGSTPGTDGAFVHPWAQDNRKGLTLVFNKPYEWTVIMKS